MPTPDLNPLEPSFVTATLQLPASVTLSTLEVHRDSIYPTFADGTTSLPPSVSNYSTEYGPIPTSLSSGGCPDVSAPSATVTVTDTQTETAQKTVYISATTCEGPTDCPTVSNLCPNTASSNGTSSQTESTASSASPTAAEGNSASIAVTPSPMTIALITSFLTFILHQSLCA